VIANVLFATTILFTALLFFLVQECAFLIPFCRLLIEKYGFQVAVYAAAVFLNLFEPRRVLLLVRRGSTGCDKS
jgi:hypothetical protein